jgi:hypothetical protein
MKVTAITPDADDPRETAPSPLSQLHPDLAAETARFLAEEAGWTVAVLDLFRGDPDFTARVMVEIRALQALGGAG